MTEDPPWLEEAIALFDQDKDDNLYNALRNALLFASLQPREITEAIVDAAARSLAEGTGEYTPLQWMGFARAALEEAEKARTK